MQFHAVLWPCGVAIVLLTGVIPTAAAVSSAAASSAGVAVNGAAAVPAQREAVREEVPAYVGPETREAVWTRAREWVHTSPGSRRDIGGCHERYNLLGFRLVCQRFGCKQPLDVGVSPCTFFHAAVFLAQDPL